MTAPQTPYVTVFVTAPPDKAEQIARPLVEERLAACANIIPAVRSIYSWKGEICTDDEVLMVLKTRESLVEALRARVVELHPYEVPEVVALNITAGHAPYLAWIGENTNPE